MKRNILLAILILLTIRLYPQPGVGGGLKISHFYNEQLDRINFNDTSLNIRVFELADNSMNSNIIHESYNIQLLYLRPSSRRLFLIYQKDTMLIDIHGIISGNPWGNVDHMDSIVFQNGYFRYFLHTKKTWKKDTLNKLLRNGLTPNTIKQLTPLKRINYSNTIDISFLSEENLPATFYMNRAVFKISQNNLDSALSDINKSIELGLNTGEVYSILCDIFTKKELYDKAIDAISEAMKIDGQYDNDKMRYLGRRIDLYIKTNQIDKALEDHESLVYISSNDFYIYKTRNLELAQFRMKYLKDYEGAILDLKRTISKIPNNQKPWSVRSYYYTYFYLAIAEYYNEDHNLAFKHWLKALELFDIYKNSSDNDIIHFDSLIKKHPMVPELYLSRAIENYYIAVSLKNKEKANIYFINSLNDINKSEDLGYNNFRTNMYSATVLLKQKKYEDALVQINIAASKKEADFRVYDLKYRIRKKLGLVRNKDTDLDWIKYKELLRKLEI